MKFSNGCWLQKEDCACFSSAQIYFTKIEKDRVTLCAPTNKINHRGDTLGGVNLTIQISAPYPEVLRIQTHHHMGLKERMPQFELAPPQTGNLAAEETEKQIIVKSGELRIEIEKESGAFVFWRGAEKITGSGWRDLAYMKTNWKGSAYDKGPEDAYMREQLSLSVGELVYGLGERFSAFVKNGQSVDIWNEDGGTSTEQSYKNIPFYLSNKGYGVFVNHPEKVSFEVATEMVTKVEFSVPGESLDYFLINGPTMKEVLMRYTDITGKPALPAPWTFGLWLSTSFTTNYDEKTVNSFVDGMIERGIPLSVFHFDCFWMKDFHWCDFTWDERVFPDPEGMLKRLKEKGLKICVWINSYVGQESPLFEEGVKGGWIRGIKLYPYAEHFMLDDDAINPVYETCLALDIPVLLHVGFQRSSLVHPSQVGAAPCKCSTLGFPVQFCTVLEKYPKLKLIMAHMGGDTYFQCLSICMRFENAYLDTAWLQYYAENQFPQVKVKDWIEHACKYLSSEKILYGGEGTLPSDILNTDISDQEKENILWNNAAKLYKL